MKSAMLFPSVLYMATLWTDRSNIILIFYVYIYITYFQMGKDVSCISEGRTLAY